MPARTSATASAGSRERTATSATRRWPTPSGPPGPAPGGDRNGRQSSTPHVKRREPVMKIVELMEVAPADHDLPWLKEALQAAVQLEFATIPPYLCAMWSVKDTGSAAYRLIREI